jgi:hypothetical protein
MAVEKVRFAEIRLKMGDQKCIRSRRKSLIGHPEAMSSYMMYFKLYKGQIPVIEQALEIAARMLGSDKSRGYCLEMICADFLAGANLGKDEPDTFLNALHRCFCLLPNAQQATFLQRLTAA